MTGLSRLSIARHTTLDPAEVGLPSSIDAEVQVIGSLLLAPERFGDGEVAKLSPDDFTDPLHKAAFAELVRLHRSGAPIDVVSVRLALAKRREFTDCQTTPAAYLAEAGVAVTTSAHVDYFAGLVRAASRKRRIFYIADGARHGALNGKGPDEVLDELRAHIDALQADEPPEAPALKDVFQDWATDVLEKREPKMIRCGPPGSGLRHLEVGEQLVTVFAAPSSVGKSALVHQLTVDALRQPEQHDLRALICSVEMTPQQFFNRQLARLAKISHGFIRKRTYDETARDRIRACIDTMYALVERVEFLAPPFTIEHVAERAEAFGAGLVVVDYAQRIRSAVGDDPRLAINEVMSQSKIMAGQGRAVILISAVTRGEFTLTTANLSCLRESSEVEYAADAAYLLIPNDPNDRGRERAVTLRCAKNRDGEVGDQVLTFRAPLLQFEVEPQRAPHDALAEYGGNDQETDEWTQ